MSTTLRTLWLIRHAKADNPVFGQTDAERPLAPRGLADVQRLSKHLARHNPAPPQWLWVSAATRTRQTAEPLADLWHSQVIYEPSLYLADTLTLLDCLQGTPDDCSSVALIGHNPGVSDLAHLLLGQEDHQTVPPDLPTLGVARLTFQGDWPELGAGRCRLASYLTPKGLRTGR
jgi:phosphohistidine phosphatase